jgi:hypothetical protein
MTRKDRVRQANQAQRLLPKEQMPGLVRRVIQLTLDAYHGKLPTRQRLTCTRRAEDIARSKLSSAERVRVDEVKLGIQGSAESVDGGPRGPQDAPGAGGDIVKA